MRRWLVIFFAVLLPLQFGWSAASAYCEHETSAPQSLHFGHHFHAHKDSAQTSPAGKLSADSDCAWCHAGAAATASMIEARVFASAAPVVAPAQSPPFTSVLTRAPDRPQWLRLV